MNPNSEAEQRLIALYEQSSPSVRRRGRSWYPEANRRLREIALRTDSKPAQAAAVFAIVSPSAGVTTALRWTEEILAGERLGGRWPGTQVPAIERVLATTKPAKAVRGPKVSAFYRAIMGDPSALVIDRWAAYAGGHESREKNIPRALYREIEAAYRSAAAACGESVRAFQAIVWIVVRESTMTARGIVPKLQDVTA